MRDYRAVVQRCMDAGYSIRSYRDTTSRVYYGVTDLYSGSYTPGFVSLHEAVRFCEKLAKAELMEVKP